MSYQLWMVCESAGGPADPVVLLMVLDSELLSVPLLPRGLLKLIWLT